MLSIRGIRFCRWKNTDRRSRLYDPGDLSTGLVLGFAALASVVVFIRPDAARSSRGAFLTLAAMLCVALWLTVVSFLHEAGRGTRRLRQAEKTPKPPVPAGLPTDAVPCIALVNTGSGELPNEQGWVWLDAGLLHYSDEHVQFALRPDAVDDLVDLLEFECAEIAMPPGWPVLTVGFSPAVSVRGKVVHWPPGDDPLYELAERWKASSPEAEPLLPPIEPAPARKVGPWFVSAAIAGTLSGIIVWAAEWAVLIAVPAEAFWRSPATLVAIGPWVPLAGFAVVRIPRAVLDLAWRRRRRREVALLAASD